MITITLFEGIKQFECDLPELPEAGIPIRVKAYRPGDDDNPVVIDAIIETYLGVDYVENTAMAKCGLIKAVG